MKKTRRILTFILTLSLFIIGSEKVLAVDGGVYNGGGNGYGSNWNSNVKSCEESGIYQNGGVCASDNVDMGGSFSGIKISVVYGRNGQFSEVKTGGKTIEPVIIYNNLYGNIGISGSKSDSSVGMNFGKKPYEDISILVAQYFGADQNHGVPITNQEKFADAFKTIFDVELTSVDFYLNSEPANPNNPAEQGYRIVIEPLYRYIRKGGVEYYTVKGLLYKMSTEKLQTTCNTPGGCKGAVSEFVKAFYTDFKDVGVEGYDNKGAACETMFRNGEYARLCETSSGCGFNIIDITNVVNPYKCYDRKSSGSITCQNTDTVNRSNFTEWYEERDCQPNEKPDDTYSTMYKKDNGDAVVGKKIAENAACKLYCIENAEAAFPGNVTRKNLSGGINQNYYLAWPGNLDNNKNMRMSMKSTFKCSIVQQDKKVYSNQTEIPKCGREEIKMLKDQIQGDLLDKAEFGATVSGGDFNKIDGVKGNLVTTKPTMTYQIGSTKYSSVENLLDSVEMSQEFTLTKKSFLEINSNVNRIYQISQNKVFDYDNPFNNKQSSDFYDRRYGFISFKQTKELQTKKTYELKINNVKLGIDNKYGKTINDYKCTIKFNPDHDDRKPKYCVCPEDSTIPGEYTGGEKQKIGDGTNGTISVEDCDKLQKTYCYNRCKYLDENGNKQMEMIDDCINRLTENKDERPKENMTMQEIANYCKYDDEKCSSPNFCIWTDDNQKEHKVNYADVGNPDCVEKNGGGIEGKMICEALYCPNGPCIDCDDYCKPTEKSGKTEPIKITDCVVENTGKIVTRKDGLTYAMTRKEAVDYCSRLEKDCNDSDTPPGPDPNVCLYDCHWEAKRRDGKTYFVKYCNDTGEEEECDRIGPIYCKDKDCKNESTSEVIFRVIDLANPFPGKSGDKRTPSDNWLDPTVRDAVITHARGVEDNEVYNKTPLYTIVLTPEKTKAIKEYNKNNSYDDFKLQCQINDKDYCISQFVHGGATVEAEYSLRDAIDINKSVRACAEISSATDFYSCYEKDN